MFKRVIKMLAIVAAIGGATASLSSNAIAGEDKVHKIVFHIDENDPKRMNMVLNNASNVDAYYKAKGEETLIEIVAYGPGLNMLVEGKHKGVQKRINSFEQNFDNISFKACGNTMKKMAKKSGKPVKLVSQAKMVPSGVVQLVMRQEDGWSYVRP